MSIVSTVIHSDTNTGVTREVKYACTDHNGKVWYYGPVICAAVGSTFDAEAFKPFAAEKVAGSLAEHEADLLLKD